MARGSKKAYTSKQRRQAKHIEDSEKKTGRSSKRAKAIAYATINKNQGGGKKSGSGRKKSKKKTTRKSGKKKTSRKSSRSKRR
jgi:hypothetical protein